MKNSLVNYLFLLMSVLFIKCANQLPPDGGPIDRIPPQIIKSYPNQRSNNVQTDYVEFTFSEYINKRSVYNSIFISPYFKDDLIYKWSGKKLRIYFPEKLKENRTYVITLGSDISDLRQNKMLESYTLIFSTGEQIDDGEISGKVFDPKPDGIFIYFYLIDSINTHINYTSNKPDFITQTSKDGTFRLIGLPYGIFRVIAIRDEMKNLVYDINEDLIGLASRDFVLNANNKIVNNVFFELTKRDTVKPNLNSVKFIDKNHIALSFNEEIDTDQINFDDILLLEESENIELMPVSFFNEIDDRKNIIFLFDNIKPNRDYKLFVRGLKDLSGNETILEAEINSEEVPDTLYPQIKSLEGNYSESKLHYFSPEIKLSFDDFVNIDSVIKATKFSDTLGNPIDIKIKQINGSNFLITCDKLKPKQIYVLKIDLNLCSDLSGNKIDSVYVKKFEASSESDYSSIMGKINCTKNYNGSIGLELKSPKTYKTEWQGKYTCNSEYQINNVKPGEYLLKLSIDELNDADRAINYSNPFTYFPDTIKVKARWPVTDVNFNLDKLIR